MDKVVDHLLVFKGNGEVQDFPGNYTQYREWRSLKSKDEEKDNNTAQKAATVREKRHSDKRRMTYKERQEYAKLEQEIAQLEAERKLLEEQLCSGTLSVDELTEKSKRLPVLKEELDEKEMRWLELSEIEQ